jgi:hypothetical protein
MAQLSEDLMNDSPDDYGQEDILNLLTISSSNERFANKKKNIKSNKSKKVGKVEEPKWNGGEDTDSEDVNDLSAYRRTQTKKKFIFKRRAIKNYFFMLSEFLNSPCIIFYYDTVC